MNPFRSRLHRRLLLVALIAATPAFAAILVMQSAARQRGRERTLADSLRLVRLAANEQASVVNGTQLLIKTLAELSEVRAANPDGCLDLLPRILAGHPDYLALTVANADGSLFCSTTPRDRLVHANARGRAWFDRVMETRTSVISDYQFSAVTSTPSIVIAQPLLDRAGSVSRIVVAVIELSRLQTVMSGAALPAGGTLTLVDRTGTILARSPDGGSWIGHRLPESELPERLAVGANDVVSDSVGVDGIRRLSVTVPVRTTDGAMFYMSLGIDHDTAFRESDRIYRSYLWLLGIVSLAGLAAAGIGSQLSVLRPLKTLKAVADRIAGGDLGARAQLASSVGGVSELGEAVNAMADALKTREQEHELIERELRASEDRYRLLFAQNPHPMWVYDAATLEFLEVNDAAVQRYGYTRSEFVAMRITDIRPANEVAPLLDRLAVGRRNLMRSAGWRHCLKSGETIDVEITSHTLLFAGRAAVVVTAQDITLRTRAEAALAERAALTALTADIGAALNRLVDLRAALPSCAEAIGAYPGIAMVEISLIEPATGALGTVATVGEIEDSAAAPLTVASWPLAVGDHAIGQLTLFSRGPLSDAAAAGLASIAAMVASGVTRRQAEDARRLLAEIVGSSDEAIYGTTVDGIVVSWNAGAERLFGYTSDAIVGRSIRLLYPADREGELQELMTHVKRGERVVHLETIRRRQDGSMVPISLTLSPMRDATGATTGTSAIARDMTERHRAEERLRLLARALESTNEMVSVTDADNRFTFVNAAFLRAYGYTAEEVIGQTLALLRSPQTPDLVVEAIDRESRLDGWAGTLLNRRRDGSEFFISLNTSAVRDDHGQIVGLLGVARDITERLRAERALQNAEERMRFALEASHVGVWEGNLTTGEGFWSTTCEGMHGVAPGTFGRTFRDFIACVHPDDRADVRQQVRQAIERRAPAETEYRTVWPDGTIRRINFIAHFTFDDAGVPVRAAGVAIDVTERRSLEEQLRQSQKMDAVGQLAGGIAHDFNNLLTVIQGCAEFLSDALPEPDERRADVEQIHDAAQRAAALTRQLLAFSRKQILSVRVVHVGDIVGDVAPMLRRLLGETIDLQTAVGNRGLVKTDPGQLQQVIVNLAVNARDAMPDGGRLVLETSDVLLDEAFERRHPSVHCGPHVMLTVTDTGHGMDSATQKRIFEPFFTTKPLGQGTGLGLATVYGIVKQSGGTIWVESQPGLGTTFKVYFPRTDAVEESAETPAVTAAPRGTESVLLIEDEEPVRELVRRVLTRQGYTVHAVGGPAAALDYAQTQHGPIDLIFSDVILPTMNGRILATQIRETHPESRVLLMSGYTGEVIALDGVLSPGTGFLPKPFTADALIRKVRDVLDAPAPPGTVPSVSLSAA